MSFYEVHKFFNLESNPKFYVHACIFVHFQIIGFQVLYLLLANSACSALATFF